MAPAPKTQTRRLNGNASGRDWPSSLQGMLSTMQDRRVRRIGSVREDCPRTSLRHLGTLAGGPWCDCAGFECCGNGRKAIFCAGLDRGVGMNDSGLASLGTLRSVSAQGLRSLKRIRTFGRIQAVSELAKEQAVPRELHRMLGQPGNVLEPVLRHPHLAQLFLLRKQRALLQAIGPLLSSSASTRLDDQQRESGIVALVHEKLKRSLLHSCKPFVSTAGPVRQPGQLFFDRVQGQQGLGGSFGLGFLLHGLEDDKASCRSRNWWKHPLSASWWRRGFQLGTCRLQTQHRHPHAEQE